MTNTLYRPVNNGEDDVIDDVTMSKISQHFKFPNLVDIGARTLIKNTQNVVDGILLFDGILKFWCHFRLESWR